MPELERTKVKFNIRAGARGAAPWDLVVVDDPEEWLDMNRHRERRNQSNYLDAAE